MLVYYHTCSEGKGKDKVHHPDINRMPFLSGVRRLTSRTKMTMTKACGDGEGIDVVINYSTAPPSLGLAYFVITTRR